MNCLILRVGGDVAEYGIVTLTAWVLVSLLSYEGKQIVIDAWAAFCCQCLETMICLFQHFFVYAVEKGNALVGADETSNDHSKVNVFGDVVACANGRTMASGARDEVAGTLSGCLKVNDGGLANYHGDLALDHGRRWGHRCHARGAVVTCVFC